MNVLYVSAISTANLWVGSMIKQEYEVIKRSSDFWAGVCLYKMLMMRHKCRLWHGGEKWQGQNAKEHV